MTQNEKSKLWPSETAVVLSDETNLFLIIRGLLRSLGWGLDITTENATSAMNEVTHQRSNCLIIVDTPSYPASEHLRVMLRNPLARLTPVLVLVSETQRQDILIYEKVFKTAVATKPLTPNNFLPAFKNLLRVWETPAMRALRQIAYAEHKLNGVDTIPILRKLGADTYARPLALEAEVALLLNVGRSREAEERLLEVFKSQPNNINTVAQLAWFYMKMHNPDQAIKYFQKIKSAAPFSTVFNLDMASCLIAAGDPKEALSLIKGWHDVHTGNDFAEAQMAKIMVAQGMINSAEISGVSRPLLRKTEELWDDLESSLKHPQAPQGTQSAS